MEKSKKYKLPKEVKKAFQDLMNSGANEVDPKDVSTDDKKKIAKKAALKKMRSGSYKHSGK